MRATKVNLRRELKHLYNPKAKGCRIVHVPPMNFLMIDGCTNPHTSPEYRQAVDALYSLSYAIRFMVKRSDLIDHMVMPLERLWLSDGASPVDSPHANAWHWTAMIMQPDLVTTKTVAAATAQVAESRELAALCKVRFGRFEEGLSAQILHIGPCGSAAQAVAVLHEYIMTHGYEVAGWYHEIYLGDPHRAAPDRLKTVLRQAVRKA